MAASLRIAEFQMMPLAEKPPQYADILNSTYGAIPFDGDETENLTVLKFTYKLWAQDQERVKPFMDNIAKTCVKVVADPKTAEPIKPQDKYEVGKFIKEVVVAHAQGTLQALEGQMSPDEKEELQKYI